MGKGAGALRAMRRVSREDTVDVAFAPGVTVNGTAGNDTYRGTANDDDYSLWQGGDDVVRGQAGDDSVFYGGAFTVADYFDGGDGVDRANIGADATFDLDGTILKSVERVHLISGHAYDIYMAADYLAAGTQFELFFYHQDAGRSSIRFDGADSAAVMTITGSDGNDVLVGGSADDTFWMQEGGNDTVRGMGGDDHVNFGRTFTARDFFDGGDGFDQLALDGGDVTVTLSNRNLEDVEQLLLGSGHTYHVTLAANLLRADQTFDIFSYVYSPGATSVTVDGSATQARLVISDSAGNDTLTGGSNIDTFRMFSGGNDTIRGGVGDDVVQFGAGFGVGDSIDGGDGYDRVSVNGDLTMTLSATVLRNVEAFNLGSGHSYDLTLAADLVAAGTLMVFNTYVFDAGVTSIRINGAKAKGDLILNGLDGDDAFTGGSGNDLFRGSAGTDVMAGGAGYDRVSFYGVASGITLDLDITRNQNTGIGTLKLSTVEAVSGSFFADTITGNGANNLVFANGGADRISGEGGDDYVIVGLDVNGNRPTGASVSGGSGSDTIDFFNNGGARGGVIVSLAVTTEQNTGQGTFALDTVENANGTNFADVLSGSTAANILAGYLGDDRLSGGDGADILYGDNALQFEASGSGVTSIFEADVGGADALIGGSGADTLFGGAGADAFVYLTLTDSGTRAADTIMDFETGVDRIDLSAIDADAGAASDQAFHLGATSGRTGDIVLSYDAGSNLTTVALYVDANRTIDATILLAGNHLDLTTADFIL